MGEKIIECQDYAIASNAIFQDNTSTIKSLDDSEVSLGKRTHHFDARLFHITDLIKAKEVKVKWCPTEMMLDDRMSKPLVGAKFKVFRDMAMNPSGKCHSQVRNQEHVGDALAEPTAPSDDENTSSGPVEPCDDAARDALKCRIDMRF